jgi:hypothetical protein
MAGFLINCCTIFFILFHKSTVGEFPSCFRSKKEFGQQDVSMFFAPARYRVVKIVSSSSEVVL